MTDTPAITKEEREEFKKGSCPVRFMRLENEWPIARCVAAAYEARLQQLEAALRRCDEAIREWWPPQTTVSPEGIAVIEAGRHAHETLVAGEKE